MLQGEADRQEHGPPPQPPDRSPDEERDARRARIRAHEESHRIVYEMVEENTRRGVPEQEIRDNIAKISESAKTAAKDRLKLRYLLKRIAREEKIEVTDAEVAALMNAHAAALRREVRQGMDAAREAQGSRGPQGPARRIC
jgi:hypothetical protein